jgi:DNA-binding SARP family transcriptional activator
MSCCSAPARGVAELEKRRVAALDQQIEADLALSRHPERWASWSPGDRPALRTALGPTRTALYRCGRQAELPEVCRKTAKTSTDELGIDPQPVLQHLKRTILAQHCEPTWPTGIPNGGLTEATGPR